MKVEKFKVLIYLKRSGLDKSGKAPIMGRITVNRTMAQFSSKLSCTPELWNPRESRLNGKSKEAVETNAKIDKLLLAINSGHTNIRTTQIYARVTDDKISEDMDRLIEKRNLWYKNSDYTVSRLFPLLSIKLVQTHLKAERSSGKPFPFHVRTMDALSNGNKRLTEK